MEGCVAWDPVGDETPSGPREVTVVCEAGEGIAELGAEGEDCVCACRVAVCGCGGEEAVGAENSHDGGEEGATYASTAWCWADRETCC